MDRYSWMTVGVVGAVALAFVNSAWIVEGANNNCAALERVAFRSTVQNDHKNPGVWLAQGFFALSDGRMAANMAAQKFPDVPTPLSCLFVYWNGARSS